MARTQSLIGLEEKEEIMRGQGEILQRIMAISHSKKNMAQGLKRTFAKGTHPSIWVFKNHKSTNVSRRGQQIQSDFPQQVLQSSLKF
jgi:hypothetical protein